MFFSIVRQVLECPVNFWDVKVEQFSLLCLRAGMPDIFGLAQCIVPFDWLSDFPVLGSTHELPLALHTYKLNEAAVS